MAIFTEKDRGLIDTTVERWKTDCLLDDGSLTFENRPGTWSLDAINELYHRFNENQLEGKVAGGSFLTKWDQQLDGASDAVRLLAAEVLLVHFLFATSVKKPGKLTVINRSLQGTDIALPGDALAVRALDQGIGRAGRGFNTRRDLQVAYLIDFVRRFKSLELETAERAVWTRLSRGHSAITTAFISRGRVSRPRGFRYWARSRSAVEAW